MTKQRRKVGRPRSAYHVRYQVRLTPEQLKAWRLAAARDDRELQSWIRHIGDQAAASAA